MGGREREGGRGRVESEGGGGGGGGRREGGCGGEGAGKGEGREGGEIERERGSSYDDGECLELQMAGLRMYHHCFLP